MHQYFISFYCQVIFHCMNTPPLSIHPLDIWVFTFWLLQIMVLWIVMCTCLCGPRFSLFLGLYVVVEILGHRILFNILRKCQTSSSYQQCLMVLISPPPYQHLLLSMFFIIAILVGGKWFSLWFWFAFSWRLEILSIFYVLLAICTGSGSTACLSVVDRVIIWV